MRTFIFGFIALALFVGTGQTQDKKKKSPNKIFMVITSIAHLGAGKAKEYPTTAGFG